MYSSELPFCVTCPVQQRFNEAPELVIADAVQQVAGYIDVFKNYFNWYVDESFEEQESLRKAVAKGEEVYDPNHNFVTANDAFVESAKDTKDKIVEYLDVLPTGVSTETLLALSGCAHSIANGDCFFTSSLPGFKELLDGDS